MLHFMMTQTCVVDMCEFICLTVTNDSNINLSDWLRCHAIFANSSLF